jgi:ubiquinone/menaquinone biosynthesis C-methylase UbiE
VDLDEYRRESLDRWERFSGNWGSEREFIWANTHVVGQDLVERLDPQPGQTILELAAGPGDTGFEAASRIGEEGRLVSTDFASGMVEEARRVGEERGIENVEYRVLDAEKMDLDDNSVDGVLCRWGYMLMADPGSALAETRRVLRDGGRLCFSVWAAPEQNLWAAVPAMELVSRGHLPPPEAGAPGIFALADSDRIRELVTGAGFDDPEIEDVSFEWSYRDPDKHWALTMKLAAPLAEAVNNLDEDERESVRNAVREKAASLMEGDSGIDAVCHNVVAS